MDVGLPFSFQGIEEIFLFPYVKKEYWILQDNPNNKCGSVLQILII